MKKNLLYIATLVGSMFLTTACDDFLDTKSYSNDDLEYLCSNPADARKMLNRVYAYFGEDSYTSRMSNNWNQNTDVEIAAVNKSQAIAHNDRRGIWAINSGDFADILTCWNHNYNAIDFANQVIEGIENSEMYLAGNSEMKQIRAEALCLRAYRYFLLCNFWGDVPFTTTPSKYGENNNTPRVDKNIIYSHLIQDLIDVEEEMMWADKLENGPELMNREFALGFIAKLSLFRAGYSMQVDGTMSRSRIDSDIEPVIYKDENGAEQKATTSQDFYKVARAYCMKLINLKDRALPSDFKNIFYTQINDASKPNSDVLFEIGFVQNGGGDVGWNIGLSVVGGSKGSGTTYTNMSPMYAASFDKEDQRFAVTCAPYRYLTESTQNVTGPWDISPAKWCRLDLNTATADKNTGINWPILRYPDVLLMLAEAENEINNGPTAKAKEMLTRVRERAFVNASNKNEKVAQYVDALNDYESFHKAIMNERAWEFGGECIRKFDLIRWNKYSEVIVNTISWMVEVSKNAHQLVDVNGELIYDKNKAIRNLGFANRLYFNIENGMVKFENDIFTARNEKETPYKNSSTIKDDIIKPGYTSTDIFHMDYAKTFISVSDTDPVTKEKYGKDENGDDIKKGVINENVIYSFFGLTDGVLINGTEDISALKTKPTPYIMPIAGSKVSTSAGVLSNDGYGIRNK